MLRNRKKCEEKVPWGKSHRLKWKNNKTYKLKRSISIMGFDALDMGV